MVGLIHIDYKAVGEVLKVTMRGPIDEKIAEIAANAAADPDLLDDAPGSITVQHFTTDRAGGTVNIAQANGLAIQAKSGVLTKAAAAAGLEVTSK
jgi:hypothetical protein